MLCNPEAIFRQAISSDDLRHLKHIWALSDLDRHAPTIAEFAGNPRVQFVRVGSTAYHAALSTAKYLVNNATFPISFAKRTGQVYLNTWHGTPLKAMGYDMPGGALDARNVVRNFLNCDYLLAPNDTTRTMYLNAYRMHNIFTGQMICEGTPRIDHQFKDYRPRSVRATLKASGLHLRERREIVLYAPTWKGDSCAPTKDIDRLSGRVEALRAKIDRDRFQVLLKVHQQLYKFAVEDPRLRPILVPNEIPANAALAETAVLVTDGSSILVDFLATGRPVLFFMPDLSNYESSPGLSLPVDEWPGPISRHAGELANHLAAIGTGGPEDVTISHESRYAAARARYCPKEDGNAAARVVDIVFRENTEQYDLRSNFSDGRETLLMYIGGVRPNGITMSALSLLENIDYDRFDVSAFFPHQTGPEGIALLSRINPKVRLIPRVGGMLGSRLQTRALLSTRRSVRRSHASDVDRFSRVLRDEWVRCFGSARFGYVIDFSGYSPFWPKILLQGNARQMSIWMHNDLKADSNREVNGRYPHRANLEAIFEIYGKADHLVSVSRSLADVNREKLRDHASPEKFSWARNTIDHRRVLAQAYGLADCERVSLDRVTRKVTIGGESAALPGKPSGVIEVPSDDLRSTIDILVRYFEIGELSREVTRRADIDAVLPRGPEVCRFVTVGRLSPEKNHVRLIQAFGQVHWEFPETRLTIIGDGPLRRTLARTVADLGLTAAVALPGHLANPFGIMSQSDCFVLSSDYEGQPMVLLEALVLGLPVISTDFASVADALPKGCGHVVERSVPGLAAGMAEFLRGDLRFAPFDYVSYNREVMQEFYEGIGAGLTAK